MTSDKLWPDRKRGSRQRLADGANVLEAIFATKETRALPEASEGTSARSICRYLKVSVWESDDFYALPPRGQSRLVYIYLLTGPHTLGLHVPGLYSIGQQALRERLAISAQQFAQAIATLRDAVGLKTDFSRCLLWIPSALKHMGPPANPNIVRSYCRGLLLAPKSPLRDEAIQAYAPFLASLGANMLEPFAKCFPEVCQTLPKPFRKEREREKEKEKERDTSAGLSATPQSAVPKPDDNLAKHPSSKGPNFETGLRHIGAVLNSLH